MRDKVAKIICALIGHSPITTSCFGYVHCSRCDELRGDTLAGSYKISVDVTCGCQECRDAYTALNWKDRLMAKSPDWKGTTVEQWTAKKKADRAQLDVMLAKMKAEREERTRHA